MNELENKILNEFNDLKDDLAVWGKLVDQHLVYLYSKLDDGLVKMEPSFRIKDSKSYLFKALYRNKSYSNPLNDIEDKIGTRVILLKSADIEKLKGLILGSSFWQSKLTKDNNQEIEDKPKIFDYQSCHLVVWPNDKSKFTDRDINECLTCEIQIRTLLQHAFAEVSHDSTYKGPYQSDKVILRNLAKAMALMEATDDYFCDIFNLMSDSKRFYANYLNELTQRFLHFQPSFDKSNLDHFLTDSILSLLDLNTVSLHDLDSFINKKGSDISKVLKPKNGLIFQQPVILLVLYYFHNKPTFLKENWTLNNEALRAIYRANNTSYDSF
tara:strand:+ start:85066 stop:86043 length:978 start_codon:yes stop_codon:yes gene_type:complete